MGDKGTLRKQVAAMKLVNSPSGVRSKFKFHTIKASSVVKLNSPQIQRFHKFAESSSTSGLAVKKKNHSWLKFPRRGSFIGENIDLNDLQHQTFIESLQNVHKNKGDRNGYAANCISVFEDDRILSLFSPRKSLKKKTKVTFKANKRNLKDQITGTLELLHGTVHFTTEEGKTVFSADVLDVKSLRYNGQNRKIFGFSAFVRRNKNEKTGHCNLVVSRVLIECENPSEAKSWIAALLLETERVGDTILMCMENMKRIYKVENYSEAMFPHTECLLRKRILLYEISLLEDSQKLNEARLELVNFLEDKQRFKEAGEFSAQTDSFFKRRHGKLSKEDWQNLYIERIRSLSDIEIIKQEIELESTRFVSQKYEEEPTVISTPNRF
eukprot:snap_masked-scaffold_24-processed-gene-4.0-mRNA-1 protein AED:1.00 eAED:1.00 QI:0/-1/0/0/-1/1/1/0/381